MINLLPPAIADGYRYGLKNVVLRRWVISCLIVFIGLGILSTYGLLRLHQASVGYQKQVVATQASFQKEKFSQTQAQVKDMSNSFRLVVKVLGEEVLFSQLIAHIAATIPATANLTGLNINQTQNALDITAISTNYNAATQLQVNLSDPANHIFSKADIVSITCNSAASADPAYPCTVNIRALFARNNPYLFINNTVAKP